jgi:tetratricopeptide (TPR) repeat protein
MDKKTLQDIQVSLRELYQKAADSGNKKNWDYAIKLMKQVVNKAPSLIPAREKLREFERQKSNGMGAIAKLSAKIKSSFKAAKIKSAIGKQPLKAMEMCEEELANFLYNPVILNQLADAAEKAGALFISIESLLVIREFSPDNENTMRKLAEFYKKNEEPMKSLQIFQELAGRHPNDLKVQSELRAATALASMHKGDWEKEGTTQEKSRGQQDAVSEQIEDGSIHDASQAERIIDKYEKELEGNDSIDIRRKLAEAYHMANRFDEALEQLNAVAEKIGSMDPAVDKLIERSYLARINAMIQELKANPDQYESPEQQIAEFEQHKAQYSLERATERVNTYPNETQLRYDLAVLYFENEAIDAAIEQFQVARKNPQRKLSCMVYLGKCFDCKGQYDMAAEQLEDAVGQMLRMDNEKLDALYALGCTYEGMGNGEKALACYKDIYQTNVNYRDVAQRIQDHYNKNKEN